MNTEEIQHKLDEATKCRMVISDNILGLKEQLTEAEKLEKLDKLLEKPEPRHGDFGLNKNGNSRIRLFRKSMPDRGENSNYCLYGAVTDSDITVLGNVFDLMKDWDKPFEEYDADKYATGIRIGDNGKIRIYACTGADCKKEKCFAPLFLKEAEDFYNALGHAIAELKRKKDREC